MSLRFNLLALCAGLCVLAVAPAHADYQLCNRTSYVLDGAIAVQEGAVWQSRGWVRMLPGGCAVALTGPIESEEYFVFARSIEAHQGRTQYFSGNERFCTADDSFLIEGRDQCAARGYDANEFLPVRTERGNDWVTTFSEASDHTAEQAEIAGTQRLLQDNGFKLSRVDGIAARNTTRAVEAFQRLIGVPADGQIDQILIEQLIAGAEQEQAKAGLDVCNKTGHLIWSALGYRSLEGEMSSGWIRIEPGQCRKAIKGKLTEREYFVYAEAVDDEGTIARVDGDTLIWSGDARFCTKPTRFEIKSRDRCAARGFDERAFMRIETGGKSNWVLDLD
ncbi:MAG: DUF1036 domain-containing protein [Parvibaculum sp.]|uniref:DUF1036 domain-containing protein n=1 Tax=Parvibaculum sp. TaxID=2024848 RepID=UPI00271C6960|nr:DUF1036 domain-containing protein [Parvibaculum sp.]MDO8839101.1 DUF1036 domain-containing protein [Parvibaculum sp.]